MSKFGFDSNDFRPDPAVLRVVERAQRAAGTADTLLDWALRYAALGWHVLPVRPDKKPVNGYGLNSASCDPEAVRQMWREHPDANIAVACARSGLVVLDVDPRNGGMATLNALEEAHGPLRSAVAASTQGGGVHRYFRAVEGVNYPGTLGPGLDVKHRGYVLVAPSHGEAGVYAWLPGRDPTQGSAPDDAPAALVPAPREEGPAALAVKVAPASVIVAPEVYADLRAALRVIPPECDYGTWFRVLQGLSRLHDTAQAYAVAHEWSTASRRPGHTEAALQEKWRGCLREAYVVTHHSVFYLADEYNREWRNAPPGHKKAAHTADKLEEFKLEPLTFEELESAQLTPRVILPYMLYADVRTRIAAGGVGKTTLALYEAITLALGRELWGRKPDSPVRTVLVTREDARETLAARSREIMKDLRLDREHVDTVLSNLSIMDLSAVGFRISSVVGDVVTPHDENLSWMVQHLREFRPDWVIMDPLVSFGVGEQRVNDAEQGLIEAMRILKKEFNCCVEGIHHSGKANAREKTLDQYSGRGGSALADGARMVCVLAPLSPAEFEEATGQVLQGAESAMVMAMPKMSYCRPQTEIYIRRRGYSFEAVPALLVPPLADVHKQMESSVYGVVHDAWLKNQPLSKEDMRADFSALFYGSLTRKDVMDALARLQRDGRVVLRQSRGGRGQRAVLEPVVLSDEQVSKFSITDLPRLPRETPPGGTAG